MAAVKKILIVDDDRALAGMLAELLQTENFVCAIAHNSSDALRQEQVFRPDLIVLDVMMPGDDGISTLRSLRKTSNVAVLMLTAMGEEDDRILGLEAGADDYLAKPVVPRELVLRIRAILRRIDEPPHSTAAQSALQVGSLRVEPAGNRAYVGDTTVPLTGAEIRILEALAESIGQVVSREHLTRFALGRELTPYDRALDTHVSHLRRKLSAVTDDAHIRILSARGTGYRLVID